MRVLKLAAMLAILSAQQQPSSAFMTTCPRSLASWRTRTRSRSTESILAVVAEKDATIVKDTTTDASTSRVEESKEFVNDGAFAWMQPFLGVFQEGKTTYYGPPVPVKEEDKPPEEEQIARRKAAVENMTNIGMEERERRATAGELFQKVTIAYAIYSSLILDSGDVGGHLARFAIALPLFFTLGYTKSAESGL